MGEKDVPSMVERESRAGLLQRWIDKKQIKAKTMQVLLWLWRSYDPLEKVGHAYSTSNVRSNHSL